MNSLEEIAERVRRCADCQLHVGRTNAVPGEGDPHAEVMFIGEAPGFNEDKQGRPFVGAAGKFLDGLLASIGLSRSQVFITNTVKSRPPNNRDPQPAEIAACHKYLERQIELINPKLIVTLGRFSFGQFCPGESITRARGKPREVGGRIIYPVLHPAAALHKQELRSTIIQDFQAIPGLVEQFRRRPAPEAAPPAPPAPAAGAPAAPSPSDEGTKPGQLSLF